MKVLVISTKCNKVNISNLKVDIVSWCDNELGLINLRDYDGIVFDMSDYYLNSYNVSSMRGVFEHHSISPDIIYDVLKKPETFIIVVGNPNTTVKQESILNLIGFSVSSEIRNGNTVTREKTGDRTFLKYLEKVKSYSYFLGENITISSHVRLKWRSGVDSYEMAGTLIPLLKNRADKILAAKLEPFTKIPSPYLYHKDNTVPSFGDIYLLPPIYGMDQNDMVSEILELYLGNEKPEPEWVKNIKVPSQEDIDDRLEQIGSKIADLTNKKNVLIQELENERQPIEILWKSDKPLEKSIERVLKSMGASIENDDENNTENAADCSFSYDSAHFAVEIKSTSKQMVDKNGLRQVRDWVEDLSDVGKEYKGLLIVSNEIGKKPDERSDNYLPENLIKYAISQEIAVISVKTLFEAYLKSKNDNKYAGIFFGKLHEKSGIIKLEIDE